MRRSRPARLVHRRALFALSLCAGWLLAPRAALAQETLWRTVPAQNPATFQTLLGVDGIAEGNVWAVGTRGINPLVERWDGSWWKVIPDAAPSGFELDDVAVIAADDVWVVGGHGYPNVQPIAEHWNGQTWRVAPLPPLAQAKVTGLSALAADDIWAVGWYDDGDDGGALYLHWDGASWSRVEGPEAVWDWMDVSALAPDDVWAVANLGVDHSVTATITHWDGVSWSVSPSPQFPIGSHERFRILALAPDDVWVVGNANLDDGSLRVAVEHYDGVAWTVEEFPDLHVADYSHFGIAGRAADDVWIVGSYLPSEASAGKSLTLHWNGSAWSAVPSPNPGFVDILEDATVLPSGVVWAVGDYLPDSNSGLALTMTWRVVFADGFESGGTGGWERDGGLRLKPLRRRRRQGAH